MDKGIVAFVVVAVLGIAAFFGYSVWKDKQNQASKQPGTAVAPTGTPGVPPPGACIVEDGADAGTVLSSLLGARTPQDIADAKAGWEQCWLPTTGWSGTIKTITDSSDGGVALRMPYTPPAYAIAAEYWVIVVVPDNDRGLREGDSLTYAGRIDALELNTNPTARVHRMVVRDAAVLTVNGKPF